MVEAPLGEGLGLTHFLRSLPARVAPNGLRSPVDLGDEIDQPLDGPHQSGAKDEDPRQSLVASLLHPDNPYFAVAAVDQAGNESPLSPEDVFDIGINHAVTLLAEKKGRMLAFEAAVAGGIPIIKALREGLTANRIQWIAGIINGTTNFILSEMRDKGLPFAEVLKEAQRLGYAEADPTFDIEGIDAAHKLTIMSAIAFGVPMQFDRAYVEGISRLEAEDIKYAEQLGYRIKLLGITKRGDKYLRTLLIHGARAALKAYQRNPAKMPQPLAHLLQRKHPNVVCVALASRNARVAWAMLSRREDYKGGPSVNLPALPSSAALAPI